jgi:hypothetical protein
VRGRLALLATKLEGKLKHSEGIIIKWILR